MSISSNDTNLIEASAWRPPGQTVFGDGVKLMSIPFECRGVASESTPSDKVLNYSHFGSYELIADYCSLQ